MSAEVVICEGGLIIALLLYVQCFSYHGAPTVCTAERLMCLGHSAEIQKNTPRLYLKQNNLHMHSLFASSLYPCTFIHDMFMFFFCHFRSEFSEVKFLRPSPGFPHSAEHTLGVFLHLLLISGDWYFIDDGLYDVWSITSSILACSFLLKFWSYFLSLSYFFLLWHLSKWTRGITVRHISVF